MLLLFFEQSCREAGQRKLAHRGGSINLREWMVSGLQSTDETFRGSRGPGCRRRPCSILLRAASIAGPRPWCQHLGRQKGAVAVRGWVGIPWGDRGPGRGSSTLRGMVMPEHAVSGGYSGLTVLVTDDVAGSGPGRLRSQTDAGLPP